MVEELKGGRKEGAMRRREEGETRTEATKFRAAERYEGKKVRRCEGVTG